MEAGRKKDRFRDLWFRLRGKDPSADTAGHVETAQRTILLLLDGSERVIAGIVRRAQLAEESIAPSPTAPRHIERFEALCEQLRQDAVRIRRAQPARDAGAQPADAVTIEMRRREAMAHLEALEGDLHQLEKQRIQERANADEWRRRAELSVIAGDDNLAREALAQAKEHEARSSALQRELDVWRQVIAELRSALLAEAHGQPSS